MGRSSGCRIAGHFVAAGEDSCDVEFFIDYEFKSRTLAMVMGAMFDAAFRRFAAAFEQRADAVYGRAPRVLAARDCGRWRLDRQCLRYSVATQESQVIPILYNRQNDHPLRWRAPH